MSVDLPILLPAAQIWVKEVMDGGFLRLVLKWKWSPKCVYDFLVPLDGPRSENVWTKYVKANLEIEMDD